MRIQSVSISNFRSFRDAQIDLSGDVCIIYGRNGVGKTAIFDAIELALLGDLGRFAGELDPLHFLTNAYSTDPMRVRLTFSDEDEHWVEAVGDPASGKVEFASNNDGARRNQFLYDRLVRADFEAARKEVSVIAELFRSSVLLSQASIRHFIEGTPEDRSRILSNLAGSAYYQRCLEKAGQVVREVDSRLMKVNQEIVISTKRLEELEEDRSALKGLHLGLVDQFSNGLYSLENLADDLQRLGLSVRSEEAIDLPVAEYCMWAKIASGTEQARLRNDLENLTTVIDQVRIRPQATDRAHQMERELHNLQASILDDQREVDELQAKEESVAKDLARISERAASLVNKQSLITRARQLRERKLETNEAMNAVGSMMKALEQEQISIDHELADARDDLTKLRISEREQQARLQESSKRLAALEHYRANFDDLATARQEHEQLSAYLVKLLHTRDQQAKTVAELTNQYGILREQKHKLQTATRERSTGWNEVAELSSRLAELVSGDTCPLCGVSHGSHGELEVAINRTLAQLSDLQRSNSIQIQAISTQLSALEADARNAQDSLAGTDDHINSTRKAIAALDSKIETLSYSDSEPGLQSVVETDRAIESAADLVGYYRFELRNLQDKMVNLSSQVALLERSIEEISGSRGRCARDMMRIETELQEYESEAASAGLSEYVTMDSSTLVEILDQTRGELHHLGETRTEFEKLRSRILGDQLQLREQIRAKRARHEEIGQALGEVRSELERLRQQLAAHRLVLDITIEDLEDLIRDKRNRLRELEYVISGIDVLVGREKLNETRGRLKQVEQEILQVSDSTDGLKRKQDELARAGLTAGQWESALHSTVKSAVKLRIRAHKPEIWSIFQSIIPDPFLLEDLEIEERGAGIQLAIKYRHQTRPTGEPRLFLSSAQANVLAIAIFLSLASRQKWSRLNALLLDDPVQHLDDLDAVAFIDMLRSVALGKLGQPKQIVVSTCDYNLYLLMIRKLGILSSLGKNITAIALDDGGPEGPRIKYDLGGPDGAPYSRLVV